MALNKKLRNNVICDGLNIDFPILLAPMAELVTPELAAAVANGGGLGALGMWGFSLEDGVSRIQKFRELSAGSLNINYPLWDCPEVDPDASPHMYAKVQSLYDLNKLGSVSRPSASACQVFPDHLQALLEVKPNLVSFHFGLPSNEIVHELKSAGICILSSATSVQEARILEANGADFIIAQGIEAGGHRGTFTDLDISMQSGLFSLLPQIVDAVSIPVIAAGGIADGRGIAAALMLGASGVQIGTAFLACDEADVPEAYRQGLSEATEGSTMLTNVVSGRHARFVKNTLVEELSQHEPFPFPAQYDLTFPLGDAKDPQFSDLLAGQSVAMIRKMPAAELMVKLIEETERCLDSVSL